MKNTLSLNELLHQTFIDHMDDGGADPDLVVESVMEDHPALRAHYDLEEIRLRARKMFASEIVRASNDFQRMFEIYNYSHFADKLPACSIHVLYAVDVGYGSWDSATLPPGNLILLRYTALSRMLDRLMSEMALVETGGFYDELWWTRLAGLKPNNELHGGLNVWEPSLFVGHPGPAPGMPVREPIGIMPEELPLKESIPMGPALSFLPEDRRTRFGVYAFIDLPQYGTEPQMLRVM